MPFLLWFIHAHVFTHWARSLGLYDNPSGAFTLPHCSWTSTCHSPFLLSYFSLRFSLFSYFFLLLVTFLFHFHFIPRPHIIILLRLSVSRSIFNSSHPFANLSNSIIISRTYSIALTTLSLLPSSLLYYLLQQEIFILTPTSLPVVMKTAGFFPLEKETGRVCFQSVANVTQVSFDRPTVEAGTEGEREKELDDTLKRVRTTFRLPMLWERTHSPPSSSPPLHTITLHPGHSIASTSLHALLRPYSHVHLINCSFLLRLSSAFISQPLRVPITAFWFAFDCEQENNSLIDDTINAWEKSNFDNNKEINLCRVTAPSHTHTHFRLPKKNPTYA